MFLWDRDRKDWLEMGNLWKRTKLERLLKFFPAVKLIPKFYNQKLDSSVVFANFFANMCLYAWSVFKEYQLIMISINFAFSQGCQQRRLQQDVTKWSGYHMGALFFTSSAWQWSSGFSSSLAKTNKVSNIVCSLHLIFIPSSFYFCYYYFCFVFIFHLFIHILLVCLSDCLRRELRSGVRRKDKFIHLWTAFLVFFKMHWGSYWNPAAH